MKYIFVAFLLTIAYYGFSQSNDRTFFKLKATQIRAILNDPKGNFMEASGWNYAGNQLLTLDLDKRVFMLYASTPQKFDLVSVADIYYDGHQDKWMSWNAVDDSGKRCTIRLLSVSVPSPGFNSEIFIDYLENSINFKTYIE